MMWASKFVTALVALIAFAGGVTSRAQCPAQSTTAAPCPTTAAPCPTTAAPCPTTAAPCPTTAAPCPTTAAPCPTTAAPCPTTAAPCPTTAGPPLPSSTVSPSLSCVQIDPKYLVDRNINNGYCQQPIYYSFVPYTAERAKIDSVCVTVFPTKDNSSTYAYYYGLRYQDGSEHYETYIVNAYAKGINKYAIIDYFYIEYYIGKVSGENYVIYSCGDFGDYPLPYVYGTTTNFASLPLNASVLAEAQAAVQATGLPVDNYYALPYKLPPLCQQQQPCLASSIPYATTCGCAPSPDSNDCGSC